MLEMEMTTIDEQIAKQRKHCNQYKEDYDILASLERLKAIDSVQVPESAQQQYDRFMSEGDERSPVERLRFFLSLALKGQDWLDVESFLDDLESPPRTAVQVPDEPKHVEFIRSSLQYAPPLTTASVKSYRQDKELIAYIDTLRDMLKRESEHKRRFERDWLEACDGQLTAESKLAAIENRCKDPTQAMVDAGTKILNEVTTGDAHYVFTAMFAKMMEELK
jgi:hypothetical protein